jgi:hypothetical protein
MIKKIIAFFVIMTVFVACHVYDDRMYVTNNTNSALYIAISNTQKLGDAVELSVNNSIDKYYFTRKIEPNQTENILMYGNDSWKILPHLKRLCISSFFPKKL